MRSRSLSKETASIHTAILPHAVAILVLIDYAMLSWFGTFAEWTGNATGMFKAGTGLFLSLNVAICVAWSCGPWNEDRPFLARRDRWMGPRFLLMAWGSLAVVALGYRISAIIRTPMDPAVADMLPVIIQAGQKILAGQDPYTVYHFVSHDTPMQWLPALWLPYVPSVWLGIDPRYLGLAAVVASAAILGLADWTVPGNGTMRAENQVHPWVRIGLAGGLLLAPAAVWFGAIGHTQVYWLYLIGFVWSLSRRWWSWAGVCLGLCLMSRHTLLPLLPLIGLYLFRCLDKSAKTRLGLSAAATVLAILLPFGLSRDEASLCGDPRLLLAFGRTSLDDHALVGDQHLWPWRVSVSCRLWIRTLVGWRALPHCCVRSGRASHLR